MFQWRYMKTMMRIPRRICSCYVKQYHLLIFQRNKNRNQTNFRFQIWTTAHVFNMSAGWSQSFLIYSLPLVGHRWIKLFMEIQWKLWLLWQPKCPIHLQRENACHHNSFSFYRIFLKIADKIDMDEISKEFENWTYRIINLRVTSPWLLKKPLFDFVISTTRSGLIFLKHAKRCTWMKSQMSIVCLCWSFTAQSTQWGHVECGQFT